MLEIIWTYKTEFQILTAGVEGTKYEPVFRQFQEGLTEKLKQNKVGK